MSVFSTSFSTQNSWQLPLIASRLLSHPPVSHMPNGFASAIKEVAMCLVGHKGAAKKLEDATKEAEETAKVAAAQAAHEEAQVSQFCACHSHVLQAPLCKCFQVHVGVMLEREVQKGSRFPYLTALFAHRVVVTR